MTTPTERYRESMDPKDEIYLGTDLDTGKPYTFPLKEWKTAWWLLGPPGTGKTSLLEVVCRQLLMRGKPLWLFDPLGPLFTRLLLWLSYQHPRLQENTILFAPGLTSEWPGLNPFAQRDYIADIATQSVAISDTFVKTSGIDPALAPMLGWNMMNFSDVLISGGLSFSELPLLTRMGPSPVRRKLAKMATDPEVQHQIMALDRLPPGRQREAMLSVMDRIPRWTRPRAMQLILGRTRNTLDFKEIIDSGKSVLAFVGGKKGLLDQSHGALLGSLLFQGWTAYMKTRDPQEANRNPVYAILDEFPMLTGGLGKELTSALDTLRNFGARIVLANQRIGQLMRDDPDLVSAVLTDCRVRGVFGGLPPDDLEVATDLLTAGDLDILRVKSMSPATVGFVEKEVISRSKAKHWSETEGDGFGTTSGSGAADISGYVANEDFETYGYTGASTRNTFEGSSDVYTSASTTGGMEGETKSTRLEAIIKWIPAHYWSLDELKYEAQGQVFKQAPQEVTFRNLSEPRRRLRVASIREFPAHLERLRACVARSVGANPHLFLPEEEAWEDIQQRHRWLEGDDPELLTPPTGDDKPLRPRR